MIQQFFINLFIIFFIIFNNINNIKSSAIVVQQQQFRRTPDNQTATISDTVTLACSIINKQGVLQWTRDGFGLGSDRNLNGYERYRMVGSEEEGDYTLVVDHVTLEDDAIFQCQVGPGLNGVKELRSANAKLTVEVPTSKPQILQGDYLQTTEDREIQIECISRGGKPAAEITWLDGNGQEIKTNVNVIKELLEDGKRYNTRSILTLTPKKEYNNKTFTCQAHNRPSKEVMSDFIKLSVKYSPKINLKIISQNIKEFDNIKISCKADGNPHEMSYRWFLNNQVITGDYSNLLILNNISRLYHNNIIKCEVTNSVGKSEESEVLSISYGPTFLQKFKTIQADLNSSVTLSCSVDGNPKPEIVWFHEEKRIVASTFPNFSIIVTPETVGKYICQAVVQGFAEISAESYVLLKGLPQIQSSKIQFGREDDLIQLECYALSIPKANSITWSHGGMDIITDDLNYSIKEDYTNNGIKSTLIIKSSKEVDFGPYNCTVVNQYGTKVLEIFLMKSKNPQLVIILTAVIASVVVIVAITMVTLLCQRKSSKKNDLIDSDIGEVEKNNINMNKSDVSSNNSDLKIEIRTASSLSNINENDDHSEQWNEDCNHSDIINNKNESLYRYSDYIDPICYPSSKNDGHNNNGYIPYANYARDYNPPMQQQQQQQQDKKESSRDLFSLNNGAKHNNVMNTNYPTMNNIDPHYSATYGNPYLRISNSNLPIPPQHNNHVIVSSTSGGGGGTGSSTTNSQQLPPHPPIPSHHQHTITSSPSSHHLNSTPLQSYSRSNTPAPQQAPRNNSTPLSLSLSSTTLQYVPSQMTHHQLKPGTLATHV